MLTGLLVNSCKKSDDTVSISALLTSGVWRLASVRTELFHGDTSKVRDTLNTDCNRNQIFHFTGDSRCTYDYFHCLDQHTSGGWQLSSVYTQNNITNLADSVFLLVNMTCQDTSKARSSRPFARVRVMNLGQNSLVLEATKADTLYRTPIVVIRRLVTRYGFIH